MLRFLGKEPPATSKAAPRQGGLTTVDTTGSSDAPTQRVSKIEAAGNKVVELLRRAARLRARECYGSKQAADRLVREAFDVVPAGQ